MKSVLKFRRWVLKTFVSEAFWPREVTLTGVGIPVRGQPFSFGVKRALCNGTYELPERTLLAEVLRPNMQVLELGSSLGIVSAIAAEGVGRHGRVVCVEASSDLVQKAMAWLGPRYPFVSIVHGYGFPTLEVPSDLTVEGFDNQGVSLGGRVSVARSEASRSSKNPLIFDLHTLMARFQISSPDILVCDIEGAELVMTDPSFALPHTLRYVMIELHPKLYPNNDQDLRRICDSIEACGFQLVRSIRATYLFAKRFK